MNTKHKLDYCPLCEGHMLRCKTCNNNCCNGMYGTVDGEKCTDCPDAYLVQDIYWKNPEAVVFEV